MISKLSPFADLATTQLLIISIGVLACLFWFFKIASLTMSAWPQLVDYSMPQNPCLKSLLSISCIFLMNSKTGSCISKNSRVAMRVSTKRLERIPGARQLVD